ncbi:MAG: hypothetical protein F6J92_32780 [Symploca sp. SIO1A3]|nr:hypothetical protein [Symploca sp. SIO1A3]
MKYPVVRSQIFVGWVEATSEQLARCQFHNRYPTPQYCSVKGRWGDREMGRWGKEGAGGGGLKLIRAVLPHTLHPYLPGVFLQKSRGVSLQRSKEGSLTLSANEL